MKKRILSFVVCFLVTIFLSSMFTGYATLEKIPIPTVEKDIYIYDQDNVIDDDVEKKLNTMLIELEQKTEAEFAVVSIKSLLGRSIEDYANNLFNTLGIGKKGKDNGVLLLFSRSDSRVRLEIGRGLEGCLNDAKCGRILDDYFVPYREKDEYTKATELTVQAVLNVVAEEYDIDITGLDKSTVEDSEISEGSIGVSIFIFFVILIAIIVIVAVLGFDSSSGGSGYSGGSSSSFSGSSFSGGGFGGGFSGGAGASR